MSRPGYRFEWVIHMGDFLNTGKSATKIAIEVCNKLHIDYELKGGAATIRGVHIRPDELMQLFPPQPDNE